MQWKRGREIRKEIEKNREKEEAKGRDRKGERDKEIEGERGKIGRASCRERV